MVDLSEQLGAMMNPIAPAAVMLVGGCVLLVSGAIAPKHWFKSTAARQNVWSLACLLLIGIAALVRLYLVRDPISRHGLFVWDSVSDSAEFLVLLSGALLVLGGWRHVAANNAAEHYGCLSLVLSGLMFAGGANDLTVLFLALELISIPTYILLALAATDNRGWEAMLKYFTLSAFASCFFLLGLSYLFGIAGTTELSVIQARLIGQQDLLALVAVMLVLCGVAFRITAAPFHFYASDVFAGTNLNLVAMLAVVPKLAGILTLVRLFGGDVFDSRMTGFLMWPLLGLATLTMFIGNIMAFVQTELKRLIAHSSIANSGYLLLGLAAILAGGMSSKPLFSYLLAYSAMTIGIVAVLVSLQKANQNVERIEDLQGLVFRRPWTAFALAISLTSFIGLPLTAGFWAKLQLFLATIATDRVEFRIMAILMAANAVLGAVYYLRILSKLFEHGGDSSPGESRSSSWNPAVICALSCAALTVFWFFFPSQL